MPVTAKLSKELYEKLGEQVTDELVIWFNQVDATYRSETRELNELNFSRFDAKMEQRLDALRGDLIARIDQGDGSLSRRIDQVEATLNRRIDQLEAKVDRIAAEQREFIERALKEQTRWMFVAWASLLIPIVGLWMR